MLFELLEHAFTKAKPEIKGLGLLRELIAIKNRNFRCAAGWAPHRAHCKAEILAAAAETTKRDACLVVGSGLWLEVPVPELASMFKRVVLCDVVHLRTVRKAAAKLQNVKLVERDATGALKSLHALALGRLRELPPVPPADFPPGDFDLTVSANLLSQLPVMALHTLTKQLKTHTEDELFDYGAGLIRAHLEALYAAPGVVCLVTDYVRQNVDAGRVLWEHDVLYGVKPPHNPRRWVWNLAPRPECSSDYDRVHHVTAARWCNRLVCRPKAL